MDQTIPVTIHRLQTAADAQQTYCCMMEVPTPWPKALCNCRDWVTENLGVHVEGYHIKLKDEVIIGHLYYAPAEKALFPYEIEPGVTVLYCDWVQRQHQGQGFGTQLFDAFIADQNRSNTKGILLEASNTEGQMHFVHYQNRGFEIIQQNQQRVLMYKPLRQHKIDVRPIPSQIQARRGAPVEIIIINGYACPFEAATQVLVREIAPEFGNQVTLREIWLNTESLKTYGVSKGVFINGNPTLAGGETEASIRHAIITAIRK